MKTGCRRPEGPPDPVAVSGVSCPMPPIRKMHRADPALATRMPGDGGLVWHTLSADRRNRGTRL